MTNASNADRPEGTVYGAAAPDEAIYRDIEAQTGIVPGAPERDFDAQGDGVAGSAGANGRVDTAKENAREVAGEAKERGSQVASHAKDRAADVAGTAKSEGRHLLSQAQEELRAQARQQQQRAASGLSATADELRSMADGSQSDGTASHLVRQAGERADEIGQWLSAREPGEVLEEVRSFARRRPGVFITAAAVAGVVAGRLARSLKDSEG